jgi:uncharacterized protein YggU (UPF0235/DUF167 family)
MKIAVHIKPSSRHESIEWRENLFGEKSLIVKVRAKPIDGEANEALIEALADFFGHTTREKVVQIEK